MADTRGSTPPKGNGGKGSPRRPIDEKTRAKVRKLARAGVLGRNAIAKECGVSSSTVTAICRAAKPPIAFDRSASRVATAARIVDLKAKRAEISEKAVTQVYELFRLINTEHEITHWDGKSGFLSRDTIARPTSGDIKNYATSIGILIDKHLVLLRADSDDRDKPMVDKWLEAMQGIPGVTIETTEED